MAENTVSGARDDSYLWDRTGTPDPQLQQWEATLGELRAAIPVRPPPRFEGTARVRHRLRHETLALAAALFLAVGAGFSWYLLRDTGVAIDKVKGAPLLSGIRVEAMTDVVPGAMIEADAASAARLRIGRIGWVEVRPNTVLQVVSAEVERYRLSLLRGSVRADIAAAPRVFVVDLPFATAIDLGCEYDLSLDESAGASLSVQAGWVAFESPGRQAIVPEGARAFARRGAGVGSPHYLDASPAFIAALARVDFEPDRRAAALSTVLAQARTKDALTLLTLLRRVDPDGRMLIHDRLRVLLPPPPGVTRQGIGAGDARMIDLWWEALGLKFRKEPAVAAPPP